MNVREIAYVGLRLTGLWVVVDSLQRLVFSLQFAVVGRFDGADALWNLSGLVELAIGVLLWRRARGWSARVARNTKDEVAEVDVPEALQRAAFAVLGLWFVVTGGASLVGAALGAWNRSEGARDSWQIAGGYGATLVASALVFAAGLALFLRGEIVADAWRRVQRLPPPAGGSDEERESIEPGPHAGQTVAFSCVGLLLLGRGAADALAGAIHGLRRWSDLWKYLAGKPDDAFGIANEAAFDFVPGVVVAILGALVFLRSARLSAWLRRRQARAVSALGEG